MILAIQNKNTDIYLANATIAGNIILGDMPKNGIVIDPYVVWNVNNGDDINFNCKLQIIPTRGKIVNIKIINTNPWVVL